MFGLRAVAGFAVYMRVFAAVLYLRHVCMACLAGVVPGKSDRMSGNFADGVAAVVPILPKALGDNVVAHHEKHQKGEDEEPRKPEKMACIFEDAHRDLFTTAVLGGSADLSRCDLGHFPHKSGYRSVRDACM
jgi:hypothetical protein